MELVQEFRDVKALDGDVLFSGRFISATEGRVASCGHRGDLRAFVPLTEGMPGLASMSAEERAFIEREIGAGLDREASLSRCPACQAQGEAS